MLIKQTPNININTCKYQMYSPLITVMSHGHLDCVSVLIQHHVNVNQIAMDDQWTPLMHAAQHNQDKIMLSLLQAGAMVDAGTTCIKPDTPINVYTRFCLNTAKSKFSLVSPVTD